MTTLHEFQKPQWFKILYLISNFILCNQFCSAQSIARFECLNPPPGTLFCEDYEAAEWRSKWTDPDLSNVKDIIDLGPSQTQGNNIALLRAPVDKRGGISMWTDVAPHQRLFARWYMKYEAGFSFTDKNHGGGLAAGNTNIFTSGNRPAGDADGWALFTYEYQPNTMKPFTYCYYHGMYQDGSTPGNIYGDAFPCVYDKDGEPYYCSKDWHRPIGGMEALPTLKDDQWYCIEQMIDAGKASTNEKEANGEYRLWVNGQLLSQANDLWMKSHSSFIDPTELYLALFYHDDSHADLGMLYDNVIISSERIGCNAEVSKVKTPSISNVMFADTLTSPVKLFFTSDEPCIMVFDSLRRPYDYETQTQFSSTGQYQHIQMLELLPGKYTFYFQAKDADGNISDLSQTTFTVIEASSNDELESTCKVKLYPNPSNHSISIDFSGIRNFNGKKVDLHLFNSLGKKVLYKENITNEKIEIDNTLLNGAFEQGIIIYKITIDGKTHETGKFINH